VSQLGWIQGLKRTTTESRTLSLDFRNYLQVRGVRGGRNVFTITVDRSRGVCLRNLRIARGTGIETTTAHPQELKVLVPLQSLTATKGDVLTIPYAIARRGGWADRGAVVQLSLPPKWRIVGAPTQKFVRIGRERRSTFKVIPQTEGQAVLKISVLRSYNQPDAPVAVQVRARESNVRAFAPTLLAGALIVAAALLTRMSWRSSRSGERRE
jgi:hypothetical protein